MALTHTVEGDATRLQAIKEKIQKQGGVVTGDDSCGTFCIMGFEGSYAADGGSLTLEITKKPVFVPDSMIQSWLRQNLG